MSPSTIKRGGRHHTSAVCQRPRYSRLNLSGLVAPTEFGSDSHGKQTTFSRRNSTAPGPKWCSFYSVPTNSSGSLDVCGDKRHATANQLPAMIDSLCWLVRSFSLKGAADNFIVAKWQVGPGRFCLYEGFGRNQATWSVNQIRGILLRNSDYGADRLPCQDGGLAEETTLASARAPVSMTPTLLAVPHLQFNGLKFYGRRETAVH